MHVIDPRKINELRSVIDVDVAAKSIADEIPRDLALMYVAHEELESPAESWRGRNGWWISLVIPGSSYYAFQSPVERVMLGHLAADEAAIWMVSCTYVARDPEHAVLGGLLRCIDEKADVDMSDEDLRLLYGRDVFIEIADSVTLQPHQIESMRDTRQLSLFESDWCISKERKACGEIGAEIRRQLLAWASLRDPRAKEILNGDQSTQRRWAS